MNHQHQPSNPIRILFLLLISLLMLVASTWQMEPARATGLASPAQVDCSEVQATAIVLFEHQDCQGASVSLNEPGFYNLSLLNNQVSSIYVPGGWSTRVYNGADAQGETFCVDGAKWNLAIDHYEAAGPIMDETISSLAVYDNHQCKPPIEVVEPLTLEPPNPFAGQSVTATYAIRNTGNYTITLHRVGVVSRGPDCTLGWECEPVVDFPNHPNVTLLPGQSYAYQDMRWYEEKGSGFFAIPSYANSTELWYEYTGSNTVTFTVSPGIELVEALQLTTLNPLAGEPMRAQFTLKNASDRPLTLLRLSVATRGPACTDWGCNNRQDFPWHESLTLQPGESYHYDDIYTFNKPGGGYFAQILYKFIADDWHLLGTKYNFTVERGLEIVDSLMFSPIQPVAGDLVTARFTMHNAGIRPLTLRSVGIVSRGPNCDADWRCVPALDFPGHENVTLDPGTTYEYRDQRRYPQSGSGFFAEPSFADGHWWWYLVPGGTRLAFSVAAPTITPTPTPTYTPSATPTPTATYTPLSPEMENPIELLSVPWHLTSNGGASEAYQSFPVNALQGRDTLRITYNLHGLSSLTGDASAIIFDQNGWRYISLSDYGQNGLNGEQTVDIPLSDFPDLNPNAGVGLLHTRFWYNAHFVVDILRIVVHSKNGLPTQDTPTPTPTSTASTTLTSTLTATSTPTDTDTPIATPTFTQTPVPVVQRKKWTMMLYLAGDTSRIDGGKLHTEFKKAINQLGKTSNPDVSVVALLDGYEDFDSYKVTFSPEPQYDRVGEVPMDDPANLLRFIKESQQQFPAEHYYLVIADHANGVQGIAWDTTTESGQTAYLTTAEMRQALQQLKDEGGEPIDVLHFDGCSFGLLETVDMLQDFADYMVVSQNTGWSVFAYSQYRSAISTLTTAQEFAVSVAKLYGQTVDKRYPYTVSVIDTSRTNATTSALNQLAIVLRNYIGNSDERQKQITDIRTNSQKFDSTSPILEITNDDWYVDLADFADQLHDKISDESIQSATSELITTITGTTSKLVIYEEHLSREITQDTSENCTIRSRIELDRAHGISIYFPPYSSEKGIFGEYVAGDSFATFTAATQWDEFLDHGLIALGPDNPEPNDFPIPLSPCLPEDIQNYLFLPIIQQ